MAEDLENKLRERAKEIIKNRKDLRKKLFEIKDKLAEEFVRRDLSLWYHIFNTTDDMIIPENLLSEKEPRNQEVYRVAESVAREYKSYPTVDSITLVAHYPLVYGRDESKSGLILAQLYVLECDHKKREINVSGDITQFREKKYTHSDSKIDGMISVVETYRLELFEGADEHLLWEVRYNTDRKFKFVTEPIQPLSAVALQDVGKFLANLGYTKDRFKVHAATLTEILQYACNIGAKVEGYTPNKPN